MWVGCVHNGRAHATLYTRSPGHYVNRGNSQNFLIKQGDVISSLKSEGDLMALTPVLYLAKMETGG